MMMVTTTTTMMVTMMIPMVMVIPYAIFTGILCLSTVSRRSQLFFTSILEKTIMMGHVITNLHVTDDLECALKCLTNQVCFSFNYLENSRKCQLNYSNKRANPNDVIDDDQSIHYDMVFSPY